MDWIVAILLFLHVGGAVVGFGPTYAFLILGPMAGQEREHLNFALRLQQRVVTRLVVPLALFQGVTGLLLVWRVGFELLQRGWLLTAIVLYVVALAISFGILLPALRLLIPATSAPPPPAGGGAPGGPPPHIVAARDRARLGGMINAALVLVIVFLMVTKPF